MRRDPYALAALAAAGIPGIVPVACSALSHEGDDIESALVLDDRGRNWVVSSATTPTAGARLAKNVGVLEALSGTEIAPYVQSPQGFAEARERGRAVICLALEGAPLSMELAASSAEIAADFGRLLARVHNTPQYAISEAGVEDFSPAAVRQKHADNIGRAHREHPLPSAVLQRWKSMLMDDSLWEFTPRFLHAGLSDENILAVGDSLSGLLNWDNAQVGDPAQDLAWVISSFTPEAFESFYTAYTSGLDVRADDRLVERAQLSGEFAVLEWLVAGIDTGDDEIVSEAMAMLREVDDDLAELARSEAEHDFDEVEDYEERRAH